MSTTAEILRGLPYFADLPSDLIDSVCQASEQLRVEAGEVIIREGSESEEMYVVAEGELAVTKLSGTKEVELARLGAGEVVGEIALLDQAPRTATVSAHVNSLVVRVPEAAFEQLLSDSRVVRRMFRTVTSRLRGIEDTLRHEERMAALGRMAAQLMHELNNPAAAVGRSTKELSRIYAELGTEAASLVASLGASVVMPTPEPPAQMRPLDRGEAEDTVADWLENRGVKDGFELAPSLVATGWTSELLAKSIDVLPSDQAAHFARWIALRATAQQILGEITVGAGRISELVRIVKDYSFLDQAPVQEVDIVSGINDTIILLKHQLREIEVTTEFPADLKLIEAPGRDLNQVWTNLIDNAAHAMSDGGSLRISAENTGDGIVVTFADTGTGMPPDVVERIFDPFYTTKQPGEGTGLGLHTVHTIIGRVGGEISVDSSPEGTTFTVQLPARLT